MRWADRLSWVGIAAVPSGLLLAVTRHLSTDVAAIPLLWVVPLFIYLATFVAAFRGDQRAPSPKWLRGTRLASVPLIGLLTGTVEGMAGFAVAIAVHLGAFALLAWGCHALLASRRPDASRLTEFYLWVSVGGAVGGTLVALVAPVVFHRVTEYPVFVAAAVLICGLAAGRAAGLDEHARRRSIGVTCAATGAAVIGAWFLNDAAGSSMPLLAGGFVAAGAALFVAEVQPRHFAAGLAVLAAASIAIDASPNLHESRTFFGVYRVSADTETHVFEHGTTIHGEQRFVPRVSNEPTTYYTRKGPLGRVITALQRDPSPQRIAAVGLGAGTIAAYGRPGDHYEFIEIDQRVVDIARDPALFRFLADSRAEVTTTVGDGRLALAASNATNDLIVLDAFSSDAIPVHLLTEEALRIDEARLAADGVIAVHISNRYFDLAPVVAGTAARVGLNAYVLDRDGSRWVALVRRTDVRDAVSDELTDWQRIEVDEHSPVWTDDYSNVLGTLDL